MHIKTDRLTKRYGSKYAVNHVSLSLTNGIYGLLGENGAGKSTLMRLLCGLQKPFEGTITADGEEIFRLGEAYRNSLGYLPQQFLGYPDFTAKDFLLYSCALKGIPHPKKRISSLLEKVGLLDKAALKIKNLSGGMKRRLGIAQAILNEPQLLVLDEPTAGLDPKERIRFRNLISAFSKGRIVLLSTHIVSDVAYIADEILMMKAGSIFCSGRPDDILKAMEGQVWECQVPASQVENVSSQYRVSNIKNLEDGRVLLRVLSDRSPCPDATPVPPVLEDTYLDAYKGDGLE